MAAYVQLTSTSPKSPQCDEIGEATAVVLHNGGSVWVRPLPPMPWRRPSKHDGCHSFLGCRGDNPAARSKRRSSSRCSALLVTMGMMPATAWHHALPTSTSSPRQAVSRSSWTPDSPSSTLQQRPQRGNAAVVLRLEAGVRSRGMLMLCVGGNTMAVDPAHEKEEPLWLGLDLSTQSLTAAVLRGDGVGSNFNEPVVLESINYEHDLPVDQQLGSKNGMKVVGSQVTSPVEMWLHALEALLQRLKSPEGELVGMGLKLSAVRGVSVSGQQHGTVYWAAGAGKKLDAMAGGGGAHGDDEASLAQALAGCFAVEDSPIWADGSTERYASELEEALGGAARLAELTGSRAHLRQGAPQIMKIHRERPEAYDNTERISLVCSFLASVLSGRYAEIETSDGSGMNLMHIREKRWVEEALEATAPGLRERLGGDQAIVDSHVVVGNVSAYLCRRFGFSRHCAVVAGSGDNCNSLAGMGVVSAGGDEAAANGAAGGGGDVMVSLGTSDTLLGVTTDPSPTTTGNTMYHPCDPAAWFAMLVYKNGSLVREGVRDRRAGGSWDAFSALLKEGRPGNGGTLGLFLDMFEITPQINRQGRFVVDREGSQLAQEELSGTEEARAVVEGRFLSMKAHARELGVGKPERVLATGGGSNNVEILQILADVFQAPVFTAAASDSAATGAALRAKHGVECVRRGVSYIPFAEVYGESGLGEPAVVPAPGAEEAYAGMMERMDTLEQKVTSAEMAGEDGVEVDAFLSNLSVG